MSWDLIADIGGTNARFARLERGAISTPMIYSSKGQGTLLEALADFVSTQEGRPQRIMIAAAGVIEDHLVRLTNAKQELSVDAVRQSAGAQELWFINDFEAAAWSLADVDEELLFPLQGPKAPPLGHRAILGPGTGLGIGCLIHSQGQYFALPGEGGHVSLGPANAEEVVIFKALAQTFPQARFGNSGLIYEAEALLSGTGLPKFYAATAIANGMPHEPIPAQEVFLRAGQGEKIAAITIKVFKRALGRIAGDFGLSILAQGGVFLTGGVLLNNQDLLDQDFLDAFNAGGRHSKFREALPVYLYRQDRFGLIGARNALMAKDS